MRLKGDMIRASGTLLLAMISNHSLTRLLFDTVTLSIAGEKITERDIRL